MIPLKTTSIWLDTIKEKHFPTLKERKNVDVLIIGGGLTGISLLYELKDTNFNVCLVERGKIGHGITSKSTAKINYLQGITYSKIQKEVSKTSAHLYLHSQLDAIKRIKEIIAKEKIDCDFEEVTSYVYEMKEKKKELENEYLFLQKEGCPVKLEDHRISAKNNYVFHPLKYLYALSEKCLEKQKEIYENTIITNIESQKDGYLCTGTSTIYAKKIVLACHYPFLLFPFFLPLRTYIEKSYILAQKTPLYAKESWITTPKEILSKRYYSYKNESYEIILGASHILGNKKNERQNFSQIMQKHNPEYIWSNEDIMTSDYMPYIGSIQKDYYISTGYNTWGMTNSILGSMIIKDIILQKENPYVKVFEPYRKMNLAKIKQYPLNMGMNMKNFLENKIYKQKNWYPRNLFFWKQNGKLLATYTENGKFYTVHPTCPHMGCSLIFNEVEKTWDCPCHASSFDKYGKCVKGPSKYDITWTRKK